MMDVPTQDDGRTRKTIPWLINGSVVGNVVALRIQRSRRGANDEDVWFSGRAGSTEDG